MNDKIYSKNTPSIIMVDDISTNLELLSGMLEGQGYKVRAVTSGKLALQAVHSDPPDLILLDINMPGMSGYEVCEKLKADEKYKDIPVIFLSVLAEAIDKVKAFGIGGVDYITKPFELEEVEARVKTHLELRRQKRQLQENYDKLEELEKLRDGLVHMLVHDLRSPLTVIAGYHELIKEDPKNTLSADSVDYIVDAAEATERIIKMVSDVLDASKLEEGKMKLAVAECDLSRLLEEGVSGVRSLLGGREIRFAPPETPAAVRADRELISRVIQNLLGNALKFTPEDGGLLLLGVKTSGNRVRVSFEDNGPGVAPEYRQKIFEKFAQGELRAAQQRYSTGLGLAFCKLAVEAHGGSIGVDSKDGKGSTFWFELPVNGIDPLPTDD